MNAHLLSPSEKSLFRKLDSPSKVQDFLNAIPINREPEGDTCLSPRRVLRERRAHCIEGAMLAAAIFRTHGMPPLIVDMEGAAWDEDHVIAVYRKYGCWGAVSKTNHATLRYREPIYRTLRELILSYFHEYTPHDDDRKSLRTYSRPVDMSRFDRRGWLTAEESVWYVPEYLVEAKHYRILNRAQIASLRRVDEVEMRAAKVLEWPMKKRS